MSINVKNIPHTRDWVIWEIGTAKNRDIWIFEEYSPDLYKSIAIPNLTHYVIYQRNRNYFRYIKKIIESYDDSKMLPTVLTAAMLGRNLAKDKTKGLILGTMSGLIISNVSKNTPLGTKTKCPKCNSIYNIHIPENLFTFRCPVCNTYLKRIKNDK